MELMDKPQPIARRLLHDELVGVLRELILEGELPPGEKVPERELCQRFGVSRTPLREALKILASEGLVTLTPNRGASVRALTLGEIEDAFPVMGALEALAGEIACRRITDAELARVRALHEKLVAHWRAGEQRHYFRVNQQIHGAILDATGNAILQAHHKSLAGRILGARYLANNSLQRWAQAVAEHEEILAALAARDGNRLGQILKAHLAHKLETVREGIRGSV